MPVERFRRFRPCSFYKAGPISLVCVSIQSKLGDDQYRTSNVCYGTVHLSLFIFKDAESGYFFTSPLYDLFCIILMNTGQDQQAFIYLTNDPITYGNVCLFNSLNNYSHMCITLCITR